MSDQALSFGPAAQEYDARRPGYPEAALEWALGPAPRHVVDLGAGTGILSRVLARLGHEVTAVEPDEAMRARLVATSSVARALAGSAEAIPLPDGSADAVTAGQAYHWFDPERAHPEIARVLRPGGVFVPVWNIRDESVPWVARLSEIADEARLRRAADDRLDDYVEPMNDRSYGALFGALFSPVERRVFHHAVPMTADGLVALMSTRSYYLTAPPEKRAAIERAIRDLAADLPEAFELPYVTAVYRAQRR
jgi:SAM-dependent methyltransferase